MPATTARRRRRQGLTASRAPCRRTALVAIALTGAAACTPSRPAAVSSPEVAAPTTATPTAVTPPVGVTTPPVPLACGETAGLALPAGWPADVPLPTGGLVTRTERRSGDRLIASLRVPGDFHDVVRFFNARLPAAGYTQRGGQLDPFDAESDFVGARVAGRWTAGLSAQCDGHSDVVVLVQPPAA